MRKAACNAIAILVLLATTLPAFALTIMTPDDRSFLNKQFVYIVGKIGNDEATHLSVTINDLKSPYINIKDPEYVLQFRDYVILDAELEDGENLVTITLYKDSQALESKRMTLFFVRKNQASPKGYQRLVFHSPEKEKRCLECHKIERDNCLECHKGIVARKYVHGPAGSGDCDICHDPAVRDGRKHGIKDNKVDICISCHDSMRAENYLSQHGPYATGSCEDCHNLHASDYPHQLLMDVNDLCKTCHAEFKKPVTHVVEKHPLSGKLDQSRPGKQMLSCASCHNAHGEKGRMFFPRGVENRMELCKICHSK